jgi:PAS domain S-box-containing protein
LFQISGALKEKGNYTRVLSEVDETGVPFVIQLHLSRVLDRTGSYLCTLISALDVTNQWSMEESRALALKQLEGTVEQMGDPTFIVSRDRIVVAWNQAMETLTGLCKHTMIGVYNYRECITHANPSLPILIDLFELSPQEVIEGYPHVSRVGNSYYTDVFVPECHEGTGTYLWIKASPIVDTSGKIIGYIQTIKDMTNWKRAVEAVMEKTVS